MRTILRPGDHVADVGANVGIYTKEFSTLVGKNGAVYSFEPVADTFEILKYVATKLPFPNVNTFHAGLGDQRGQREIVIPEMEDLSGYYWAHFASPEDRGTRETVEVRTLDELWKSGTVPQLQFIKCDVEGSELEVFKGAREVLASQKPGLLVEVSKDSSKDVFSFLQSLGYGGFTYATALNPTEHYRDGEFSNYFFFHPSSSVWTRLTPPIATRT
jgi:FkbM family methyltransferase